MSASAVVPGMTSERRQHVSGAALPETRGAAAGEALPRPDGSPLQLFRRDEVVGVWQSGEEFAVPKALKEVLDRQDLDRANEPRDRLPANQELPLQCCFGCEAL